MTRKEIKLLTELASLDEPKRSASIRWLQDLCEFEASLAVTLSRLLQWLHTWPEYDNNVK